MNRAKIVKKFGLVSEEEHNFCKRWLKDFNGTEAYIECFPRGKDMKRQVVRVRASELLRSPKIQKHIHRILDDAGLDVVGIREQLGRLGKKSRYDRDKIRALELLGKHKGMFIERQEVDLSSLPKMVFQEEEEEKKQNDYSI